MKRSRILTKFKSYSSGQIAALLVVGTVGILTVMVGAAALVTDVGNYYYNYFRLQSAADAAVISGAKYLPCNQSTASSTAKTIAQADGVLSSEVSSQPTFSGTTGGCGGGNGPNTIKMTVTRAVPFYFGRAVGLNSGTVSVSAAAQVFSVGTVNNPTPIGLSQCLTGSTSPCPYTLGETPFPIAGMSGSWTDSPGSWGPVTYSGNSVSVNENITARTGNGNCSGCEQQIATQLVTDYNNGVQNYPNDSVTSSGATITPGDPRLLVVPIVNWTGCTGACQLPVVGFANLWITSVSGSTVYVTFVSYVDSGQVGTGTTGSGDVGSVTVKLTS